MKNYLIILLTALAFIACEKNDSIELKTEQPKDSVQTYSVVYLVKVHTWYSSIRWLEPNNDTTSKELLYAKELETEDAEWSTAFQAKSGEDLYLAIGAFLPAVPYSVLHSLDAQIIVDGLAVKEISLHDTEDMYTSLTYTLPYEVRE